MTPAQRTKRIESARVRLTAAQTLLAAVADDMGTEAFALTAAEKAQWGQVIHTLTALDKTIEQAETIGSGR